MLSLSSDYDSMVSMYNSVKGSSSCHNPNDAFEILVQRRLDLDRPGWMGVAGFGIVLIDCMMRRS